MVLCLGGKPSQTSAGVSVGAGVVIISQSECNLPPDAQWFLGTSKSRISTASRGTFSFSNTLVIPSTILRLASSSLPGHMFTITVGIEFLTVLPRLPFIDITVPPSPSEDGFLEFYSEEHRTRQPDSNEPVANPDAVRVEDAVQRLPL